MEISQLKEEHKKKELIIRSRLNDFKNIKDSEIFYELLFCLLTPQTSAKMADRAILQLKARKFHENNFNPVMYLEGIRFLNNKAKYLLEAKGKFTVIKGRIKELEDNPIELRNWLIENVKGMNYKESGHFIRNIGLSDNKISILDRHILKNLHKLDVISEIPNPLSKKQYLEIEKKFLEFSKEINIPIDELDLLFWSMEAGEVFK